MKSFIEPNVFTTNGPRYNIPPCTKCFEQTCKCKNRPLSQSQMKNMIIYPKHLRFRRLPSGTCEASLLGIITEGKAEDPGNCQSLPRSPFLKCSISIWLNRSSKASSVLLSAMLWLQNPHQKCDWPARSRRVDCKVSSTRGLETRCFSLRCLA